MSKSVLRRPSPALAVSFVALILAPGGGAYAATTSDTKSDKRIANKVAKSYFNSHIAAASVSHASTAGSATSATNATNANHATTADSAQPDAFAEIDGATATVISGKGIANSNITHPSTGTYCITGLAFTVKGAQVTTVFNGNSGQSATVTPGSTGFCPQGGQVITFAFSNVTHNFTDQDMPFNVVLYG